MTTAYELSEIAEDWASRLMDMQDMFVEDREVYESDVTAAKIDLSSFKWCIVGEAYGFDADQYISDYGTENPKCGKCKEHADNISVLFESYAEQGMPDTHNFVSEVVNFIGHFKTNHIEVAAE